MRKKGIRTVTPILMITLATAMVINANTAFAEQKIETPVLINIDNTIQSFSDPALLVDGSTMVPMRSIFEILGATVEWWEASQQVVAKKEDKTIYLTIGKKEASVRVATTSGDVQRGVKLTQSPQMINSVTYVPLRFVSEALGAEVSWDANSQIAFIQSNPAATPVTASPTATKQVINGIEVRYGTHTYGSKNQNEYDKVMAIIDMAVKKVPSIDLGEDFQVILDTYLDEYLSSNLSSYEITSKARQNPDSEYYQGIVVIDSTIGSLLRNGVALEKSIELLKGAFVASSLVQEVPTSPTPSGARSAADTLLYNITDCDAMSNVYIAVFDSLGYNTAIVADSADAGAVIEMNGVWYSIMGGGFNYYSKGKVELSKTLPTTTANTYNGKGTYLHTPPTFSTQSVLRKGLEKQEYIINEVDQNTGYVKPKGSTVSILSASTSSPYTPVQVNIDNKLQSFSDPALLVEGSTMVPMRSIFETLGASVEWKEASQQVVAKKEDKTIFLTIGRSQATVRVVTSKGNQDRGVTLTQSPQLINSVTYVPLRFVSEALGAEVSWDANSQTAFIQSNPAATPVSSLPTPSAPVAPGGATVVDGIQVRYGTHTYGSKNQLEYTKVMGIIDMAVEKVSTVELGEDFEKILDTYLDQYVTSGLTSYQIGQLYREDPYLPYNEAMHMIDNTIGAPVKAGVPLERALEMLRASLVAASLVAEVPTSPTPEGARSAADTLLNNITDCDATANVYIALYDALGYNTAIIADSGDAGQVIEVNGVWYTAGAGGITYYSKNKIELSKTLPTIRAQTYTGKGNYLHTPPTFSSQPSGA